MKKIKIIALIIVLCAFLFTLANIEKMHTLPWKTQVDLTDILSDHDEEGNLSAFLSGGRVYIGNEDSVINSMTDLTKQDIFSYICGYTAVSGDKIFVAGTDNYKGTALLSSEKVARISKDGEFEGYVYQKNYDEDDEVASLSLLDLEASKGYVYIVDNLGDKKLRIIRVKTDGNIDNVKPEILDEIKLDEEPMKVITDVDNKIMYIVTIFQKAYAYHYDTKELKETELKDYDDYAALDKNKVLDFSNNLICQNIIFALSISVILLAMAYLFFLLIQSKVVTENKNAFIITVLLIVAVVIMTQESIEDRRDVQNSKLAETADIVTISLQHNVMDYDNDYNDYDDFAAWIRSKDIMDDLAWCNKYIDDICKNQGRNIPLFIDVYAINDNEQVFVVQNSFCYDYLGERAGTLSEWDEYEYEDIKKGITKSSFDYDHALGSLHTERRYLHNKDGGLLYAIEVTGVLDTINSDIFLDAVKVVLHLVAILAFVWVLFSCLYRYADNIKEYLAIKDKRSLEGRIKLSGIYFFIINMVMHLDYFLLVMVTVDICGGGNPVELAAMLALPLTCYRIGSWLGSVLTSTIIKFLGERRSGIISAIASVASFMVMAYACYSKNIYLLAGAKLVEGVFLESVLFILSEGMPYEYEDEELRRKSILDINDSGNASVIVGLMVAGFLAEHVSYMAIYILAALSSGVLLWLSWILLRTPEEERLSVVEEDKPAQNAWLAFIRPKVLWYLLMVVFAFVIMLGFEEYVFPIYCESSGLSDMEISDMGVLVNLAAFLGIEGFLPKNRYSPLMMMVGAFVICGLALCLLMFNSSIVFIFIILLVVKLVSRTIADYKVLVLTDITSDYGYDDQEVQQDYYAVEDGLKIFQAPILSSLCSISIAICCVVSGIISAVLPGLYGWMMGKKS